MEYPEMIYRCKECEHLVEDEDGNWVCDVCDMMCLDMDVLDCSAVMER